MFLRYRIVVKIGVGFDVMFIGGKCVVMVVM